MIEVLRQAAEDVSKAYDVLAFAHTERALELLAKTRTCLRQAIKEHAMYEVQRLGQEIEQEPVCPDCKAKVLYECVACSSNNYPPQRSESSGKPSAWVGLTDEEAQWIYDNGRTPSGMMEMVEAKLKQKNT